MKYANRRTYPPIPITINMIKKLSINICKLMPKVMDYPRYSYIFLMFEKRVLVTGFELKELIIRNLVRVLNLISKF